MWTCLYLAHIVVIIMIIISALGIVYGIMKKKIKPLQVIVIFLFCIIAMALVSGITAMQYVDENKELDGIIENVVKEQNQKNEETTKISNNIIFNETRTENAQNASETANATTTENQATENQTAENSVKE